VYCNYRPHDFASIAVRSDDTTHRNRGNPTRQAAIIASLSAHPSEPAVNMQTINDDPARRLQEIQRLEQDLEKLQQQLADDAATTRQALNNFAHLPDLGRLRELIKEQELEKLPNFDLMQVIQHNLWQYEHIHSNIVSWLLDPQESHGAGSHFLKNFLFRTCQSAGRLGISAITPAAIHAVDWCTTTVIAEWRNIDILILNREARFVCAIENKISAPEGIDQNYLSQLTRYRQLLNEEFPDYTKHLVFLDFKAGLPSEPERAYWTPENYATILQLVEQTVEQNHAALHEHVRAFMQQYAFTLRKRGNAVPESDQLAQQARNTYLKNRDMVEFLYRHKPDYLSEGKRLIRQIIAKHQDWIPERETTTLIRFRPREWSTFPAMNTGTGWPPSEALMLFEFRFYNDFIALQLTTGLGSNEDIRNRLINTAARNPQTFNRAGADTGNWIALDVREDILDDHDLANWDDPCVPAKLEAWVKDFAENHLLDLNEAIVNCLREYHAEHTNP